MIDDNTPQVVAASSRETEAGYFAIRDIMTIAPDASLREAAQLMHQSRINALPVVTTERRLVGIIGIRDILRAPWPSNVRGGAGHLQDVSVIAQSLDQTHVQDVMAKRVVTASENTPIREVLATMVYQGPHPIPIVEDGILTGLVSRHDLVSMLLGEV